MHVINAYTSNTTLELRFQLHSALWYRMPKCRTKFHTHNRKDQAKEQSFISEGKKQGRAARKTKSVFILSDTRTLAGKIAADHQCNKRRTFLLKGYRI